MVSSGNGWYVGKIVPANGADSYANSVDLNVPAGSGYRIFVYYRATTGDAWGIYGMSPGTVNVTGVFNAISVTAPTGTSSKTQGSAQPVTWTTNTTVASGEFSIWVVSPANGWYVGKIVAADGTASYANSVTLNVPVDTGYRIYVYYRASSGDAWGIYGMSPGTVNVTAVFNAITVTAPTGTTSKAQGAAQAVTWTTNTTVTSGQFSLWVVSSGNGWYVGKIVAADGTASYSNSVTLNVPVDTGYRIFVYYRATSGDPWGIYGMSPGTVNVTAGFSSITVTAPTGTSSQAQGGSLPVTWTTNQTVASGQFSLWVVSASNGWYVGKIINADGTGSYANSVTLNVPVDTGYRIFVYYRATTGDPWGIYGMSPGTVNVTAVFNAITVTAPTGSDQPGPGRQPAGHLDDQPRRSASGQFSLWVVSSGNGWYVGKIVAADGTASYSNSVDLERAGRHRLPHLRLLPRHHGRPLGHLRDEPRDGRT